MNLSDWQVVDVGLVALVIGVFAMILSQIVKLGAVKWLNKQLSSEIVTIIVLIVSVVLAVIWQGVPAIQSSADPFQTITTIMTWAGGIFAFAEIIYNLIGKRLTTLAGLTPEQFLLELAQAFDPPTSNTPPPGATPSARAP